MITILLKATLKELAITYLISVAFLNSVLIMEKLLRLSRLLAGVGVTPVDLIRILLYLQPQILLLTIPMSLLLTALIVYGRMNLDNEITILRSSGMNFRRISLPFAILGFFSFFFSLAVSFYLGPKSSTELRNELREIIAVRSAFAIEEGTFNTSFRDIVILIKNKKEPDILQNIFIYDNRHKEEPKVLISREGSLFIQDNLHIGFLLRDGYVNVTKGDNITELFFEKYRFSLSFDSHQTQKKTELTPGQLLAKTESATSQKERNELFLEFHRRLSLPAVCLILILLGTPLSLMAGKSGRLGGLVIGLLVFTGYYLLVLYGENLAMAGTIPHYAGSWMATLVLGIFSFSLFLRENLK